MGDDREHGDEQHRMARLGVAHPLVEDRELFRCPFLGQVEMRVEQGERAPPERRLGDPYAETLVDATGDFERPQPVVAGGEPDLDDPSSEFSIESYSLAEGRLTVSGRFAVTGLFIDANLDEPDPTRRIDLTGTFEAVLPPMN